MTEAPGSVRQAQSKVRHLPSSPSPQFLARRQTLVFCGGGIALAFVVIIAVAGWFTEASNKSSADSSQAARKVLTKIREDFLQRAAPAKANANSESQTAENNLEWLNACGRRRISDGHQNGGH